MSSRENLQLLPEGTTNQVLPEPEERKLHGRERINAFTNQNSFYQHTHQFDGFRALVIEPKGLSPVSPEELLDYVDEFPEIEKRGLGAVCLQIAKFSHEQNGYRGSLLGASEGVDGLTSYGNHYLIKYSLGDGSVIACDLTVSLGTGKDVPQVLVIREENLDKLIDVLNALYEGDWQAY